MKEIKTLEFLKNKVIQDLIDYMPDKEIFEKEYNFFYIKKHKDYYGKEYSRRRIIATCNLVNMDYPFFNKENLEMYIYEGLPIRIIESIILYYKEADKYIRSDEE